MGHFPPRGAETGLDCPACNAKLRVERQCRSAHLICPQCGKTYEIRDFIALGDEKLETFLDSVYLDRI